MRSSYWSNSAFADWIRKTPKPGALTSQGWGNWTRTAKAEHPVRYWIAEELLDYLQKTVYYIPDRLNDVRYYINNRWISRSHSLTAHPRDIKPGTWSDVGSRFLPCLFNELVDFVEIEQAWHHCLWSDEAKTKYNVPWWRSGWLRWRTWRNPEAGVEYLEWASSLTMGSSFSYLPTHKDYNKPTQQAVSAREILDLYYWWKEEYPNRPDVHDVSGWSAVCERRRQADPDAILGADDANAKERAESTRALKLSAKIEKQYEDEDERMMIRLIKIRQSLWT